VISPEQSGDTLRRIREFRSKDIEKILEIEEEAFPKTAYPKEVLLQYALRLPGSFLVLETEAGIVGYVIYDPEGHIISMAVKTSHRRKGTGTELFRYALERVEILWLEVRAKNHGAIRFYEKMGMRTVGKVADYYEGDDALIMVLNKKKESPA
jgi:ribosomal-protein-alanine N-acetyltransferase